MNTISTLSSGGLPASQPVPTIHKQGDVTTIGFEMSQNIMVIEKEFPMSLQHDLSQSTWDELCNRVDAALSPLNSYFRAVRRCTYVTFIPCLIVGGALMKVIISANGKLGIIILILFLAIVAVIVGLLQSRSLKKARGKLDDNMQGICSEFSKTYPNLVFHFKTLPMGCFIGDKFVMTIKKKSSMDQQV
jgi:hypothetical protein